MRAGRTAKRHVEEVTIRKREEVQVETPVEKVERARGHAVALENAIAAYAKANGCSRSIAMEAVLAHPTTSEYVRLDKQFAAAQREAIGLQKLEGSAGTNHPINRSKPARTPTAVRPSESGRVSSDAAPTATNDEMTAEEVGTARRPSAGAQSRDGEGPCGIVGGAVAGVFYCAQARKIEEGVLMISFAIGFFVAMAVSQMMDGVAATLRRS